MYTETVTPNLLKIEMFGFVAQMINVGNVSKPRWTVNFPNPLIAANEQTFKQYLMFVDYVGFFLQELNGG